MSDPVIIKKYENRRLYDTRESRYINLQKVAELVRRGRDVQVVDARTGADLTRQVLTQIIVEGSKEDPEAGPPVEFLRDLVRAQEQAQRDFLHWYLAAANEVWERLQEAWEWGPLGTAAPWRRWEQLWDPTRAAAGLMQLWRRSGERRGRSGDTASQQEEPAAATGETRSGETRSGETRSGGIPSEEDPRQELAELRQRLEELEQRLGDDDR